MRQYGPYLRCMSCCVKTVFMPAKKRAAPDIQLNLNVRGLKQSATLAINEYSARLAHDGQQVYRLGLGQSPFPVPQVVVDELKVNAHQKDYLPVCGLRELRSAVADHHRRKQGVECTGKNVLIGPGSKELMFLLQLVYYGDLVIPTPSWVSYATQAQIIGRQIRWLQTQVENGWRLMPDELDRLCADDPGRPRLVILNYPSNPTGGSYKVDELKQLAKVARKYKVILLADEIYGEIHHRGQHVSVARYYPEGTIISSGLSKWCGAGGWRLGTFTFPNSLHWLLDAMAVAASETFTSTSAPIQYAAVRAFMGGVEIEHYLTNSRRILRALGRYCWKKLRSCKANVQQPTGGFYLFPDFSPLRASLNSRGISDNATLCARLLEDTGVATLPGSEFGRPADELTLRLAYVDFDGAAALLACEHEYANKELDAAYMEFYCPNVVNALTAMNDWFRSKKT